MNNIFDSLSQYYNHSEVDWGEKIDFPNSRTFKQYTHRIFNRYPARSISLVPRAIFRSLKLSNSSPGNALKVLDPFMGSGTTAIEANLQNIIPYGVEIDPFARLISSVSAKAYRKDDLQKIDDIYKQICENWEEFNIEEKLLPKLYNIKYWFDENNFCRLLRLKNAIYTLCDKNFLDIFKVIFADIIRPCSRIERQSLKPYISKKYKKIPQDVIIAFKKSYKEILGAIKEYSEALEFAYQPINWIGEDGTDFDYSSVKMEAAVTSPPYINALDYVRCIKIESAWVDCANDDVLSKVRKGQVGDHSRVNEDLNSKAHKIIEPYIEKILEVDKLRYKVVYSYFNDMYNNLNCVFKSLKNGGEYHLIIGNSVIRKIEIPTHEILATFGELIGFKWTGYYYYQIKDHRTSIPRKNNGGKIKLEHVITLKKI